VTYWERHKNFKFEDAMKVYSAAKKIKRTGWHFY
jgi:hypothetical protein